MLCWPFDEGLGWRGTAQAGWERADKRGRRDRRRAGEEGEECDVRSAWVNNLRRLGPGTGAPWVTRAGFSPGRDNRRQGKIGAKKK